MKGLKRLAKKLRDHAVISHALASLLRPVQRCCSWLDGKIRWNVRVNGGAVFYDGIRLMFPRGVGLVYSSLIFWEGVNGYEPPSGGSSVISSSDPAISWISVPT